MTMAGLSVHGFAESLPAAARLAEALGAPCRAVEVHRFPDGESLVTAREPAAHAVLYRSLDDPNAKIVEVLLAASALRDQGARRVTLVAPYLCYMRQDRAFAPGQAVSQRVIGQLLAQHLDALVSVAPHLHRTASLAEVAAGIATAAVDPSPALAALATSAAGDARGVLIGPDAESAPLVGAVAARCGWEFGVATKERDGDRCVRMMLPPLAIAGRLAVLVDDMISTGATMAECARLVRAAGAVRIEALTCHALFGSEAAAAMAAAGISRVGSCDSVPHASNAAPLAEALAEAVRRVTP